jgi:type VI secretion system protein ImpM
MQCGLFGKVPSKRDFIAIDTPRGFLNVWEPWMQGGLSASRQSLGEQWQQAFLTAPIWRFWLGAELCGTSILGAFMPSLDAIGRYFPLTLIAHAADGRTIPPPELDPQDAWFHAAEDYLLSILDQSATFETVTSGLEGLVRPSDDAPAARRSDVVEMKGGMVAQLNQRALPELLTALRLADHANVYAAATFWWTIGGEDYPPLAMSARRMPDPFQFTEMLTGNFAFGFE